jgi:hypothetical protein
MPVQLNNFHKDAVVLRIVAAIVTQQKEAGTSVSLSRTTSSCEHECLSHTQTLILCCL